jgi:hypothetical protein
VVQAEDGKAVSGSVVDVDDDVTGVAIISRILDSIWTNPSRNEAICTGVVSVVLETLESVPS